jgi:5-methylcytosine-specific restriction endonuclease McrA
MSIKLLKPLHHNKHARTARLRGPVLMRLRQKVFVDHLFTCARCGLITQDLELDHIQPLNDGGTNDESNLQPLCKVCHKAKTKLEGPESN